MKVTGARAGKVLLVFALASAAGQLLKAQLPQAVGTWLVRGTVADARVGAAAVTLEDGRTLIAGGQLADGSVSDSVVIYDPVSNASATAGQLFAPRVNAAATLLADGRVLVSGGLVGGVPSGDVEIFDLAAGTSAFAATLAAPRAWHASARLFDDTVLIVGGTSTDGVALATAEIFDPETSAVYPAGAMAAARAGASATTMIDKRVLIAGGHDGAQDLATAEIYDAYTSAFTPVPTQMTVARSGHTALLLPHNGSVLLAGGTAAGSMVTTTDLFLPAVFPDPYSWGVGSFAPTGSLVTARAFALGGALGDNGLAYVAGGGAAEAEAYRFATIKTDKDDYAPGELAIITGSGWQPGEEVTLTFQEDPAVHEDYLLTLTADALGNIYWDQWAPEEHDLNVRFYLTAQGAAARAQMTFTDSRTVQSVTLNGVTYSPTDPLWPNQPAISVAPGATITTSITVSTDNGGGNSNWRGTGWRIATAPGAFTCFNNVDETTIGTFTKAVNGVTAPSTPGSYSAYFVAYSNDICSQGVSTSFVLSAKIIVDDTAPTVTLNQAPGQADPTNASPVNFRVVFSEPVSNFTTGDITLSGTAGATTAIVTGSGTTYNVAVSGMTGNGTVIAALGAGVATDAAGNGNSASTSADNSVTYDVVGPTVTINQAAGQADPTNSSPVSFTVIFSESVANFSTGDVTLGGTAGATTVTVSGSGTTYNVAVSNMAGTGTVTASLAAGVATDAAGNASAGSTSTDNTVLYDVTPPVVASITRTNASPTNVPSAEWTVEFSKNVTGVTAADFTLVSTGISGTSSIASVIAVDGDTYTVAASTGNGTGTLGLNVVDDDSIVDVLGNRLGGTGPTNGNFIGQVYSLDRTLTPTITAASKPYDGTNTATILTRNFTSTLTVSADVTVTDGTATFADADAGIGKIVTATGLALAGADAARFILSATTATTTADITKVNASVNVTGYSGVYDGSAHGATGTATGIGGIDLSARLNLGATFTNVPGGTANWTFNGGTNYNNQSGDAAIVITPATASIVVNGYTGVYDGAPHGASLASATGVGGANLSASVNVGNETFTNVPGGTVNWSFNEPNYVSQSGTASIVITQAVANVVVTGFTGTYDALAHGATGSATGINGVDLSAGLNLGASFADVPGGTASWTFEGGVNYTDQNGTAAIVINQAVANVVVTGFTGTYDGLAHGATGTATGIGNVDLSGGLNLGASFTDVPGGTANWSFEGGLNYTDQNGTAAIVINQAIATVTVTGYTGTYNALAHGATGSATGVGGVDLSSSLNLGATFTDVPGGTANWTFEGGTNYTDQSGTAAIVINQAVANVVVTGFTGTYDTLAHGATGSATGINGVDLSAGLNLGATFTDVPGGTANWTFDGGINYTNQNGTAAIEITQAVATVVVNGYTGTYDAQPHGATGTARGINSVDLSAGLNLGATFTDVPGGTANWTFDGGINYTNQNGTAAIEITQAVATVVVNGYTGTYDALPHGATGTATGINSVDLSAGLNLGATFTDVPGGTANWTFDGGINYTNQNGTATIVITRATAAIDVAGYTGVYDAAAHGASVVSATGVGGANLSGSVILGGETFTNVPGGTASWTFTGGTNYIDQTGTVNIVINRAAATVNVAGYTGVYDAAAHGASLVSASGVGGANLTGSVTLGGQTFTNVPGGTATWSFANQNYVSQSGSAAIIITPAAAIINVAGYTGPYDGVAHGASLVSATGVAGANLSAFVTLGQTFADVPGGTALWSFAHPNYGSQVGSVAINITPWKLDGFLQPVGIANTYPNDLGPTPTTIWNTIKGGQTVPLKFRLFTAAGGSELTNVSDVLGFSLLSLPCWVGAEDPVEEFSTSGSTALRYTEGQFIQNWASPKGANRCYRVTMTARDGSHLSAFFKTK